MNQWKFRDFQRPGTSGENSVLVNEILIWTLGLPKKAQAKLDVIIVSLQSFPVWPPQYISALKGYPDIFEIRAGSCGVQYRPLGCYGPGYREFTILIGSIEKGGKLPKGDCDSAVERRRKVLYEGWPTCEHEFAKTAPRKV
jgi:hypothetical protein